LHIFPHGGKRPLVSWDDVNLSNNYNKATNNSEEISKSNWLCGEYEKEARIFISIA